MKVAIIGTPGSGKTTLAAALSAEFGLEVMTAGDIARQFDPGAIARGDMGDPGLIKNGVEAFIQERDGWVLDGYPRASDQQVSLTSSDVEVILLTCRHDLARERLLRRKREDDTDELIQKKIREQTKLMELDYPNGWAYELAGWRRILNTSKKRPPEIARDVIAYLKGDKREVY